jgi:hypothetical protein
MTICYHCFGPGGINKSAPMHQLHRCRDPSNPQGLNFAKQGMSTLNFLAAKPQTHKLKQLCDYCFGQNGVNHFAPPHQLHRCTNPLNPHGRYSSSGISAIAVSTVPVVASNVSFASVSQGKINYQKPSHHGVNNGKNAHFCVYCNTYRKSHYISKGKASCMVCSAVTYI